METTNPLKEIMLQAGRNGDISNRSYYVKAVNNVLKTDLVSIKVCPIGKVWEGKDGKDYDLKVTAGGWNSRIKIGRSMEATDILRAIGNLLLKPEVKEKVKATVFVAGNCQKCGGTGYIPHFHYYCSGICFDCLGIGFDFKNKTSVEIDGGKENGKKELKGRAYINQFYVSKNYIESFPDGVENIKAIGSIGHETAEQWLGKKDGVYYIHQPICKANGWYAIPENEYPKFENEFKKQQSFKI